MLNIISLFKGFMGETSIMVPRPRLHHFYFENKSMYIYENEYSPFLIMFICFITIVWKYNQNIVVYDIRWRQNILYTPQITPKL